VSTTGAMGVIPAPQSTNNLKLGDTSTSGLSAKHLANGLSISFAGSSEGKNMGGSCSKSSRGATTITPINSSYIQSEKISLANAVAQKAFMNGSSR